MTYRTLGADSAAPSKTVSSSFSPLEGGYCGFQEPAPSSPTSEKKQGQAFTGGFDTENLDISPRAPP